MSMKAWTSAASTRPPHQRLRCRVHAATLPLLFPRGELGWHPGILRGDAPAVMAGDAICSYCVMEGNNLRYLQNHQRDIRAECYQGLYDAVAGGVADGRDFGQCVILPSRFVGGPRYMQQCYKDAMAIAKLDAAAEDLRSSAKNCTVHTFAADVTDYAQVCEALTAAHLCVGHIDILVCCAGSSRPGRFLEQDLSAFRWTMDLNYHGTVHTVKAVLPHMVAAGAGHLVLVASAAAVCGIVGLSSYCPTKYAVRGLADSLRNELLASGVRVSVAYPPDTDTPGYAAEQKTKPPECHAFSRAAGDVLYSPEQVARCMVHGIEAGAHHLPSPDFGQNVMIAASAGLTPRRYPVALECLLAPLVVLALRLFGWVVDSAVMKAARLRA
ncbi:hypothetical protein WJX81_000602 [Elliptochloris bilobata]|uniref:Uncharacterized protein n=1 Tax=Elliptochloris bilobata TaxID=381761 RepID=A0AAW1QUD3_9CHLO